MSSGSDSGTARRVGAGSQRGIRAVVRYEVGPTRWSDDSKWLLIRDLGEYAHRIQYPVYGSGERLALSLRVWRQDNV